VPTYSHDGLELHYDTEGAGVPVVCVHGATGTGYYEWSEIAHALRDRYRLVVPDLRGHGHSDHRPGEIGIAQINGDLMALIEHERLGRPHVLAFSFGAEAVLELELLHPGTCRSLVLLSPGLGDPKSSVPSREQLEAGWPRALRQLHVDRHGETHWLDVMLELCERAAVRPKADLDALASIACPILLIAGSEDDPRRIHQARILEDAHPRCRLVVIDGARHAVHKDRALEVAAAIDLFLAGVC
jgi:pimeloyl-ACP methyl ester carboxylesterase